MPTLNLKKKNLSPLSVNEIRIQAKKNHWVRTEPDNLSNGNLERFSGREKENESALIGLHFHWENCNSYL